MKSHRLSAYARIALVAAAAGVMSACAPVRHHPAPAPYYAPRAVYYDYWYYPAIGCYYDPRMRVYIYFEQDHWMRARTLPAHVRPYLGHHVVVHSPHDRPHEEHHRHRERYTAKNYVPDRYQKTAPAHPSRNVWIGAPRPPSPERDRDDRRKENGDRDRNGTDQRRGPQRDSGANAPHYRAADPATVRQAPPTRTQNGPDRRKAPAGAIPARPHPPAPAAHASRQPPTTRAQDAPSHREPPAKAAPVTQDGGRAHERRQEDTRNRANDANDGRNNGRNNGGAADSPAQPGRSGPEERADNRHWTRQE